MGISKWGLIGFEKIFNKVPFYFTVKEVLSEDIFYPVERMSGNRMNQARYTIVASVALFSRQAIDSGLPEYFAYNISDSFIQYANNSQNIDEINYLFFQVFPACL